MDMIDIVRSDTFFRDLRQQHGNEWNAFERGRPGRTSAVIGGIDVDNLRRCRSNVVFWQGVGHTHSSEEAGKCLWIEGVYIVV
jgi:hypothetical protein